MCNRYLLRPDRREGIRIASRVPLQPFIILIHPLHQPLFQ